MVFVFFACIINSRKPGSDLAGRGGVPVNCNLFILAVCKALRPPRGFGTPVNNPGIFEIGLQKCKQHQTNHKNLFIKIGVSDRFYNFDPVVFK
jgi:hypothetical protein